MQAEAVAGLWWGWVLSWDDIYLTRLAHTLDWIEQHQLNIACGEWFATLDAKGDLVGTPHMSYTWKSSYHTLRAMLFGEKWIRDYLSPTSHGDDMLDKQGALWNNRIDVV